MARSRKNSSICVAATLVIARMSLLLATGEVGEMGSDRRLTNELESAEKATAERQSRLSASLWCWRSARARRSHAGAIRA
jgi:hypothetical protein